MCERPLIYRKILSPCRHINIGRKGNYLFFQFEAKDVEGLIHDLHLLHIIDRIHSHLPQTDRGVVVNVIWEKIETLPRADKSTREFAVSMKVDHVGDEEVEDVVTPLTSIRLV